jgi:hypothetical protein
MGKMGGSPSTRLLYLAGRGLQLVGMWMLLVDLFTAGPLGPSFGLFAIGVGLFVAGWLLARGERRGPSGPSDQDETPSP